MIVIVILSYSAIAQENFSTTPCGSIQGRSAWLKKYQKNPQLQRAFSDTILYVPISLHLLGTDVGLGYYSKFKTLDALCQLNADFQQANIQFFLEGDIRKVNNTAWYNHATVLEGAEMMFANNIQNTLNCYIVSDPAGNCGYNLPYGGIALKKTCIGTGDHTWAHETGHAFHLPHPFYGWEGGVSWDGSIPYNYSDPAPNTVLCDYTYFKDTLIMDTLIIDTVFVERMDGSNCDIAADGFCDTPPDYLNYRWDCDDNAYSTVLQHDPTNTSFKSDGTFIMSYSSDHCQSRFSVEQIAEMRTYLQEARSNWLYNQVPGLLMTGDSVHLQSPINDTEVPYGNVNLSWQPMGNATNYILQISLFANFDAFTEYELTSNVFNLTNLQNNRTYYWRVRAYNHYDFCANTSSRGSFLTRDIVRNNEISESQWEGIAIYPNILKADETNNIQVDIFNNNENIDLLNVSLYDVNNRQYFSKDFDVKNAEFHHSFNLENLSKGMYVIKIENKNHRTFHKILIQ